MIAIRRMIADQCGTTMVEFALAIPTVVGVLFGIVDFSRALYAYDLVSSAARIGTRYAMVRGSACPTAPACTVTATQVQTYVRSVVTGITSSSLTVTTTWPLMSGCAGAPTPGCPVNVVVSYPFSFVIWSKLAITMTASSQMVISQ